MVSDKVWVHVTKMGNLLLSTVIVIFNSACGGGQRVHICISKYGHKMPVNSTLTHEQIWSPMQKSFFAHSLLNTSQPYLCVQIVHGTLCLFSRAMVADTAVRVQVGRKRHKMLLRVTYIIGRWYRPLLCLFPQSTLLASFNHAIFTDGGHFGSPVHSAPVLTLILCDIILGYWMLLPEHSIRLISNTSGHS